MDANLILLVYIIPMAFGTFLMTPLSNSFGSDTTNKRSTMHIPRRRLMAGLTLVCLVSFAVSAHTLWITWKISEGAAFCTSTTVFSCDDVLGNSDFNTDPFFGMSWGLIGMFVFGFLLFMSRCVMIEPDSVWSERYLKFGTYITLGGIAVIALLVSYEIQMEKICQYCTTAHAGNIVALFGFWKAGRMHEMGTWNDDVQPKSEAKE